MRVAVAVTLAGAVLLTGCARERYATSYDTFVEARQQDAVDRGWIPAMLPEEATELHEVHAPADDLAVVRATIPGGILPEGCRETTDEVGEPPLAADWVPEDLRGGTTVACDVWVGRLDGRTLVLWTDRASEADTG